MYDERFFLDYIDHNFIKKYKETDGKIMVVKTNLFQSFSENQHSSITGDLFRFKIYLKDFKLFCSTSFYGIVFYYFKIIYRALKLSVIHKNIKFINLIFDNEV